MLQLEIDETYFKVLTFCTRFSSMFPLKYFRMHARGNAELKYQPCIIETKDIGGNSSLSALGIAQDISTFTLNQNLEMPIYGEDLTKETKEDNLADMVRVNDVFSLKCCFISFALGVLCVHFRLQLRGLSIPASPLMRNLYAKKASAYLPEPLLVTFFLFPQNMNSHSSRQAYSLQAFALYF
jgi:hypothetical protein